MSATSDQRGPGPSGSMRDETESMHVSDGGDADASLFPADTEELPDGVDVGGGTRAFNCIVAGEVVGYRWRDAEGRLIQETQTRNGRRCGLQREWDEDGYLTFETAYDENGAEHGVAKQWYRGRLFGTY